MKSIEVLDKMIESGTLKYYSFQVIDMDGKDVSSPGDGSRETDRITLVFPSGEKLNIGTFCSGSAENTCLIIE
jgi:hypothetical protein